MYKKLYTNLNTEIGFRLNIRPCTTQYPQLSDLISSPEPNHARWGKLYYFQVASAAAGTAGVASVAAIEAQRQKNVPVVEGVGKSADMDCSSGTGTRSIQVSSVIWSP